VLWIWWLAKRPVLHLCGQHAHYGYPFMSTNTRQPGSLASTCSEAAAINHCVVKHCVVSRDQQAVGQLIRQTGEYFSPSGVQGG